MRNVSSCAERWAPRRPPPALPPCPAVGGRRLLHLPSEAEVRSPVEPGEARAMAARLGALAASGLYRRRQHRPSPPPAAPG